MPKIFKTPPRTTGLGNGLFIWLVLNGLMKDMGSALIMYGINPKPSISSVKIYALDFYKLHLDFQARQKNMTKMTGDISTLFQNLLQHVTVGNPSDSGRSDCLMRRYPKLCTSRHNVEVDHTTGHVPMGTLTLFYIGYAAELCHNVLALYECKSVIPFLNREYLGYFSGSAPLRFSYINLVGDKGFNF